MALQDVFPAAARSGQAPDSGLRRIAWLALLLLAAIGSSFTFACVTPFAAFAVLTAATLSRRAALSATVMIWLANQVLGYTAHSYPFDAQSLTWGVAIGAAAVAATFAAMASYGALRRAALWQSIPVAFVAAFAVYEGLLYLASLVLGGSANFALDIDAKVALSDAGWLLGIGIVRYWLASFAPGLARARQPVHS